MSVQNNNSFYSYEQAVNNVKEFEEFLTSKNIKIENDTILERIGLNIFEMYDKYKNSGEYTSPLEFRKYYSEILGLNDLIIKLLRIKNHKDFDKLIPHLIILNEGSVAQNTYSLVTDAASNKIFELLIAAICMSFSEDIELDHPENSKGDNPDVMVKYDNKKWGIACKVLHSENVKTIHDNLLKGIDQIEKSEAEKGFVAINLKNIIDLDKVWPILNIDNYEKDKEPIYGSYTNLRKPTEILYSIGNKIWQDFIKEYDPKYLKEIFKEKKTLPGFLLFIQTAISISINGKPYPTTFGIFLWVRFSENMNFEEQKFLFLLNLSMHNI